MISFPGDNERDPVDGPEDTPDRPDIWVDGPLVAPGDNQPAEVRQEGDRTIIDFDQPGADDSEVVDVSGDDGDGGDDDGGGGDDGDDNG